MLSPRANLRNAAAVVGLVILAFTELHAEEGLAFVVGPMVKPACDQALPGYSDETAANYAAWRRQHQARIDEIERDPDFRAKQAAILQTVAAPTPEQKRELERACRDIAEVFQAAAPADPRFASPEKTWALFHASLRTADRGTALSCLAGRARRKFSKALAGMTDRALQELSDWVTRVDIPAPTGDSIEGTLVLRDGHADPVRFLRLGQNWKIVEM